MARITKVVLTALLVGGLFLIGAPVGAHVQAFDISDTGAIMDGQVGVRGYIDCSNNHTFRIEVRVVQPDAVARGSTTGMCASMAIPWEVRADVIEGSFEPGRAEACARVLTFLLGQPHGDITHCETIQLIE